MAARVPCETLVLPEEPPEGVELNEAQRALIELLAAQYVEGLVVDEAAKYG